MITTHHLQAQKQKKQAFTAITAYDASFTQLINQVGIETILVGDSLGNVIQGHGTTVPVTVSDITYHTHCVARANRNALLIADMPYMSYTDKQMAIGNATTLMQAGAHMIKVEGGLWLAETISHLVERGIPVCGHLGLTPQTVHALGGFKVQGRDAAQAQTIFDAARALEEAGASMLVLECVPASLAADITSSLKIPVIGIGAGNATDGQILVLHDLLGLNPKPAKFVKDFMQDAGSIEAALRNYKQAVSDRTFPSEEHSFSA